MPMGSRNKENDLDHLLNDNSFNATTPQEVSEKTRIRVPSGIDAGQLDS